ncbi:MAG TPA: hypothetical protein VHZ73_02870 [Vicinamibacterales bacterium]|nr:hypothetical protein [Vicinamibacterales bacterium]
MNTRLSRPIVRPLLLLLAASATLALAGCYTYPPGYRVATMQRLSPEQAAAIQSNSQLSQADRDRLTRDNAQVAQQDANASYGPATTYAYPAAPAYSYDPYYYGYPYYDGFYPFYPALGLSFRFGGGFRGGFHGGGFHGGGFHGGFHGHR